MDTERIRKLAGIKEGPDSHALKHDLSLYDLEGSVGDLINTLQKFHPEAQIEIVENHGRGEFPLSVVITDWAS